MESLARGFRFSAGATLKKTAHDQNVRAIFVWSCKILCWLFELIAGVFTCLFMMWFFLPEISPDEKRRKDLEWLRRKAADEEWLHRRDADYQRKLEEEYRWPPEVPVEDQPRRIAARQANAPYSVSGIEKIRRELSGIGTTAGIDAQLAKDIARHLDNSKDYHREAFRTYRHRTTGND